MDIKTYALTKSMIKGITKGEQGERGEQGDSGLPYIMDVNNPYEGYQLYNNCEYHITPGESLALDLNFDLTWNGTEAVSSDTSRSGQIVAIFTVNDELTSIGFPANVIWASSAPVFKYGVTYIFSFVPFGNNIIGIWASAEEGFGEDMRVLVKSVYGVNRLKSENVIAVSESDLTLSLEDAYYRASAQAGSYGNNDLKITFAFSDISLTENRYVKFRYRTDSVSSRISASIVTSINEESWLLKHPVPNGDESWHEEIIDIFEMTGGCGVPEIGERGIKLILKPFGSGDVTLTKDHYFDIEYIACFTSMESAENYVYDTADDKVSDN